MFDEFWGQHCCMVSGDTESGMGARLPSCLTAQPPLSVNIVVSKTCVIKCCGDIVFPAAVVHVHSKSTLCDCCSVLAST